MEVLRAQIPPHWLPGAVAPAGFGLLDARGHGAARGSTQRSCCCCAPLAPAPCVWAKAKRMQKGETRWCAGLCATLGIILVKHVPLHFQPDPVKLPLPVGSGAVACCAVPAPGLLRLCWGFGLKDPMSVPEEPQETLPLLTLRFLIHETTPQRFFSLHAGVSALRWAQEGTSPCV